MSKFYCTFLVICTVMTLFLKKVAFVVILSLLKDSKLQIRVLCKYYHPVETLDWLLSAYTSGQSKSYFC